MPSITLGSCWGGPKQQNYSRSRFSKRKYWARDLWCWGRRAPTVETGVPGLILCGVASIVLGDTILETIATIIQQDPPDPNYQTAFVPTIEASSVPQIEACSNVTFAAQAAPVALDDVNEWLYALDVTNNGFETAVAAGDASSEALQYNTFQSYMGAYNTAAQSAQTDLTCFANLLAADGLGTQLPTEQELSDALSVLQTQDISYLTDALSPLGFTTENVTALVDATEAEPPLLPAITVNEALDNLGQSFGAVAVPEPVPEPSSLDLFGSGIMGLVVLVIIRRRRRSAVVFS